MEMTVYNPQKGRLEVYRQQIPPESVNAAAFAEKTAIQGNEGFLRRILMAGYQMGFRSII